MCKYQEGKKHVSIEVFCDQWVTILTLDPLQWVITPLFITGKEAITVEEVGPLHLYGLENVAAFCAHSITCGAAGQHHLVALTTWCQHGAAQHSDLWVALSSKQRLNHTQEEILGT